MTEKGSLPPWREALVDLAATLALRDRNSLLRSLRYASRFADVTAIDEVILQSHLFLGYPIALEAMVTWRGLDGSDSVALESDAEDFVSRGAEVCRRVYGANYERLRQNVGRLHPDFDRWMVEVGYGRVIGRPALDLATRELCIVALLAVWDTPRQLHSHLRGAVNTGASLPDVEAALSIAFRHLPPDRISDIQTLWRSIRSGLQ